MKEGRSTFTILRDKPTGKRTFGTPRPRWEDNIRINLKEIDFIPRSWVDSGQDRDY